MGLLFAELLFNIAYIFIKRKPFWAERSAYRFDRKIGYSVKSNLSKTIPKKKKNERDSDTAYYFTGEYGFRWYEGTEDKCIWFVGDSFTESVYFINNRTFCGKLHGFLGKKVKIVNSGLGGCRQVHMREIIKRFKEKIKPNLLFVQISHNDFYDKAIKLKNPENKYSHRVLPQIGRNELAQIMDNSIQLYLVCLFGLSESY